MQSTYFAVLLSTLGQILLWYNRNAPRRSHPAELILKSTKHVKLYLAGTKYSRLTKNDVYKTTLRNKQSLMKCDVFDGNPLDPPSTFQCLDPSVSRPADSERRECFPVRRWTFRSPVKFHQDFIYHILDRAVQPPALVLFSSEDRSFNSVVVVFLRVGR